MVMVEPIQNQGDTHNRSLKDFISIEEAVKLSGYTEQYLRRMARAGKIEAIKFGFFWLIGVQSLEAYMAKAGKTHDKRFGPRDRSA